MFHPAHFANEAVPAAMSNAIRRGRQEGLEWWSARQINVWERGRRSVRLKEIAGDRVTVERNGDASRFCRRAVRLGTPSAVRWCFPPKSSSFSIEPLEKACDMTVVEHTTRLEGKELRLSEVEGANLYDSSNRVESIEQAVQVAFLRAADKALRRAATTSECGWLALGGELDRKFAVVNVVVELSDIRI